MNKFILIIITISLCACGGGSSSKKSKNKPANNIQTTQVEEVEEIPVTPFVIDFSYTNLAEGEQAESIYGLDWKLESYGNVFGGKEDLIESTHLVITFNEVDDDTGFITGYLDCHHILFIYTTMDKLILSDIGEREGGFGSDKRCFEERSPEYQTQFDYIMAMFDKVLVYHIDGTTLTLVDDKGESLEFSAIKFW